MHRLQYVLEVSPITLQTRLPNGVIQLFILALVETVLFGPVLFLF